MIIPADWFNHFGDDRQTCRYCGQHHKIICPLVTAIEYQYVDKGSIIRRIELKDRPETITPLWQVHEEAANG